MYSSDGGVSGHVIVRVGMDDGVGVAWVVVENASVLNCGWSGEQEGNIRGLSGCDRCEGVVSSNEDDAQAYARLGEVFRRILCIESNEVVHCSSLSPDVCHKLMELLECCHIFQNNDRGAKQENEFKYRL